MTELERPAVTAGQPAISVWLLVQTLNGRLWFSVNERTGEGFKDNEGYFEFDVTVGQ